MSPEVIEMIRELGDRFKNGDNGEEVEGGRSVAPI
jgi:hypothetical protein